MKFGICGKIASGKTEVMKVLEKAGFKLYFADEIVRELYKKGNKGQEIVEEYFGEEFLDANGDVDRLKLREFVFADEPRLQLLNRLIHPIVFDILRNILPEDNYALESVYFPSSFDGKLVWVERPYDKILKTLIGSRGFSEDLARKAVALVNEPAKVDYLIRNSGALGDLKILVEGMINR